MTAPVAPLLRNPSPAVEEHRDTLPPVVERLLRAPSGAAGDDAWAAFLDGYSGLLLRVAAAFAPGYDAALDRYAYMLDELRRQDYRRLRTYAADGRGRFTTWLTVVARRLCLDHFRQHYGRNRSPAPGREETVSRRAARRRLSDLAGAVTDLSCLPDPTLRDPGEVVDERDRRQALEEALAELGPADRLLLQLRFEEGLTAREIAPLLGLPSQFHVYRRIDLVCGMLRARLTASRTTSGPWRAHPGVGRERQCG